MEDVRAMDKKQELKDYLMMFPAAVIMAVGIYFFRFPNHFMAGGVTGLGVLFAHYAPNLSATMFTNILNVGLLIIGVLVIGKGFGLKTFVFTIILTAVMSLLELLFPMKQPLTNQPFLELFLAILLPSIGSAMLFMMGASGGGTDIIALILKKYTHIYNTGVAILIADFVIAGLSFLAFDVQTGIFSMVGLMLRMLMIDAVLASLNRRKYFHIVTNDPASIKHFITDNLGRSATLFEGKGAYTGEDRTLIVTVLSPKEALDLRMYIKKNHPNCFMLVNNTSEIYAKGFRCNI